MLRIKHFVKKSKSFSIDEIQRILTVSRPAMKKISLETKKNVMNIYAVLLLLYDNDMMEIILAKQKEMSIRLD